MTACRRMAIGLAVGILFARPSVSEGNTGMGDIHVGDAYVRCAPEQQTWTVGTGSVEQVYELRDGQFRLVSFKNKLTRPAREYVTAQTAAMPFVLDTGRFREGFSIQPIWDHFLPAGTSADPAEAQVRVTVRKGEMIGFGVGPHGGYQGDQTQWITTLDYGDGETYRSTDDSALDQGPRWRYYIRRPGTGSLEPIDGIEYQSNAQERVRIPGPNSGHRAQGDVPHVGATMLHPSNDFDAVRVWQAPKDGTVAIRGRAQHVRGTGDVDLNIFRLKKNPEAGPSARTARERWKVVAAVARQVSAGGRPAAQLDLTLARGDLRVILHALAYPGASLLRSWLQVENTGSHPLTLTSVMPLALSLRGDDAGDYQHYWMVGGNTRSSQGLLESASLGPAYHKQVASELAAEYWPWTAWQRGSGDADGAFVTLDHLGRWALQVDHDAAGPIKVSASVLSLAGHALEPRQRIQLPLATVGVFHHDLDDMGVRLYNWQYEYLWDYTRDDYYALMQWDSAWYNDARNLQENFAGRLGQLDMDFPDMMRTVGMEVLWDDAGWSENPNIWAPSREGPDFGQTQRYLRKMGMKWALWFCGRPTPGLMDTKVGSWGDFQWRTDGIGGFDFAADRAWRDQIQRFRTIHPESSFHTCNGGGSSGHQFEIQRYADINMFSDPGGGDQTNTYFSYLDTPDKWMDLMPSFYTQGRYLPDTARQIMTMVPCWDLYATPPEQESLRRIAELYHYLLDKGVAGRWTYVFHPLVTGDAAKYYFQRTSHDRTRACIILKHRATGAVNVRPSGLLPDHVYVVGFDTMRATSRRTGADLMTNGIVLADPPSGEVVFLGLPDRPGSGQDTVAPTPPSRVLTRREANIGHSGVGIYWSPGADNHWISYYEVRRNEEVIGKVSVGTYYFDHVTGWNPRARYAVRTVDGDGNSSAWMTAETLPDEPLTASALGGHFSTPGRDGWSAETMAEDGAFQPMQWIAPAKSSAGDANGTPNQPGGAEGYWEGAGSERVGRGWQQAGRKADCVRAWTAARTGTVRILGRAMKEFYRRSQGTPLRVRILHGEQQIWPQQAWALAKPGDLSGCAHDLTVNVKAGDTIRFVLGRGDSPEADLLAWMPLIVYVGQETARPSTDVVRIRCGADRPFTDASGNRWSADRFCSGGTPVTSSKSIDVSGVDGTPGNQALYGYGRQGTEFTYKIPVAPGLYSVRLKFAEPVYRWSFQRPFNVAINGRQVMRNFDICQAARGARRAYDRVFHYLVPNAHGLLEIRFWGGYEPLRATDRAIVQAIEVLPEIRPAIRIHVGADRPFVDWSSCIWDADSHFEGGRTIHAQAPVSQASPTLYDQALYQTARGGKSFRYVLSVPPGLYTVHLKFAELWLTAAGQRPMDIEINGRRLWSAWDPATAAGQVGMAADIRAENVEPDAHGQITIQLSAAGNQEAILQGIEIE